MTMTDLQSLGGANRITRVYGNKYQDFSFLTAVKLFFDPIIDLLVMFRDHQHNPTTLSLAVAYDLPRPYIAAGQVLSLKLQ